MRIFTLIILALAVCPPAAFAQTGRELVREKPAAAQTRTALIIGNGAYTAAPPLKNPPNDARDMAATLKALGFDVTTGINVGQRDMKRLIREFGQKLKAGGSGLFYFAGHGVQSKGRNYLIPFDAEIQSEAEVEDSGVDLNLVLNFMDEAQNGLNIVILDACRNNPFGRSFRSATSGLAQVDAPTGTLIAYATAPGTVASDGAGLNGLYTSELLKQMRIPGQSATDMFMRVRAEVMKTTAGKQVPWEASSLVGAFYFKPQMAGAVKPATETSANSNTPSRSADAASFELSYWDTIKESTEPQDFISYLEKYPKGQFVELARRRAASALSPTAAIHAQAGDAFFTGGRFAEAETEFRLALYFNAGSSAYHGGLAKTLDKLNKTAESEAEKKEEARAAEEEKKEADRRAEAELKDKVKADPNSVNTHVSLASFYKRRDRWPEAQAEFEAALRASDYSDGYTYCDDLVEVLVEQKKFSDAEAVLKARIARRPSESHEFAAAYLMYGRFLKKHERLPEAESAMLEAMRLYKGYSNEYIDALTIQRKFKEADAAWREFLRTEDGKYYYSNFARYLADQKRWPEAEAVYREAIKQKPADDDYHGYLAKTLEAQNKIAEAEAEFREAVRLSPRYKRGDLIDFLKRQKNFAEIEKILRETVVTDQDASSHAALALFLAGQKRFDEAAAEYREWLRMAPTAYNNWIVGLFFRDQRKWKEAEPLFREAVRLEPNNRAWVDFLAMALSAQKKFTEAEAEIRAFIKRKDTAESRTLLSYFLIEQNRLPEAEAEARQAIKFEPRSTSGYVLLGRVLAKEEKPAEAEAAYRQVLGLDAGTGHYNLAEFFKDQRNWVAAEAEYKEYFSPHPDYYNRNDLAFVLKNLNKQAEADVEAKKAETGYRKEIQTNPNATYSHNYLAFSLEIQNKLAEAETEYREAVRLDPDSAKYKESLQRVLKAQGKVQ